MTVLKTLFLAMIALPLSSCGKNDGYVAERPSLSALCGRWMIHFVNDALRARLGEDFWNSRSVVGFELRKDGTADLFAFPAFKGNERNAFSVVSGSAKWRLTPLERVDGSLIWNVLLIVKEHGVGIPFVLKKDGDRYMLDYMIDEDAPTGIQFVLVSPTEQKKK